MRLIWWMLVVSLFHGNLYGFVAGEIRPGVIELRSAAEGGLEVQSFVVRARGKAEWLYFCVGDRGPRRKQRCFYTRHKKYPSMRAGMILDRIEYGLGPRIQNKHGWIAIGQERYFYPVQSLETRAP